jgi:hypothetical protein
VRTLRGTTTTSLSGNTSGYTEEDTRYRREFRDYNFVAKPSETATERYGAKPATAIRRYLSIGIDQSSVGNRVVDDLRIDPQSGGTATILEKMIVQSPQFSYRM